MPYSVSVITSITAAPIATAAMLARPQTATAVRCPNCAEFPRSPEWHGVARRPAPTAGKS